MTNNKASADHLLTTSVPEVFSWSPDLIIYHDKCADGIVAAWACWKRWGDSPEYLASNYGHQPPADVAGRNILMVDFSFPEADLRAMVAAGARSIVILDHHKTAQAALWPFALPEGRPGLIGPAYINYRIDLRASEGLAPIVAVFDMERSGARMAWEFAFPDLITPRLVELAERYDLWRFKPGTMDHAEIMHLTIQAGDLTIARMDLLADALEDGDGPLIEGAAIYDWRAQLVAEITSRAHLRTVAGIECAISVECPYSLVSAVGHHLLDLHPAAPFAAMSVTGEKAVTWSLRSHDDRMDVSEVAKGQGGGGHRNAAGFRVDIASLPATPEKPKSELKNPISSAASEGEPVARLGTPEIIHEDDCDAMQRPRADCTCVPVRRPGPSDRDKLDAERYRWLRDHSCPPHNFYISVPDEFSEVRYVPSEVDAYIDDACARQNESAK